MIAALVALSLMVVVESTEYGPLCSCKHYRVFTDELFWDEAQASCQSMLGELAKIADRETDELIRDYLKDFNIGDEVKTGFWIGLHDSHTEDTFKWPDEEKLLECGSYSNWKPGEPNNNIKKSASGQDCVQLWKKRNYMWDDDYCSYRPKGYICEFIECADECLACVGVIEATPTPTLL
ncbi:perlucin-like protein [Glandiceps talaboti]